MLFSRPLPGENPVIGKINVSPINLLLPPSSSPLNALNRKL